MKTKAYAPVFARTLARALVDFKTAIELGNKSGAHLQYTLACGLIGGAVLSGGISKRTGKKFLSALEQSRVALMDAFGEAPGISVPSID